MHAPAGSDVLFPEIALFDMFAWRHTYGRGVCSLFHESVQEVRSAALAWAACVGWLRRRAVGFRCPTKQSHTARDKAQRRTRGNVYWHGLLLAVLYPKAPKRKPHVRVCLHVQARQGHDAPSATPPPCRCTTLVHALAGMHVASQHGLLMVHSQLQHMSSVPVTPAGLYVADCCVPGRPRGAASSEQCCSSFRALRCSQAALQRCNAMQRLSAAAEQPS